MPKVLTRSMRTHLRKTNTNKQTNKKKQTVQKMFDHKRGEKESN